MKRKNIVLLLILAVGVIFVAATLLSRQKLLVNNVAPHTGYGDVEPIASNDVDDSNRELVYGLSMEEAVGKYVSSARIPTAIPDGYKLDSIERAWDDGENGYETLSILLIQPNNEKYLLLHFCNSEEAFSADYGKNNFTGLTAYNAGGHTQYLWETEGHGNSLPAQHALWGEGNIAYGINATISKDEIEALINSMYNS